MAVQQAGGNADPRIHALSVAINLEELDPTPFLQYLKTQVEYYSLDKGVDYPDLESEEIRVHECDSFTLAHQDGEFLVFEDLATEDGAVELFEICVEIEGTAGSDLGIEIEVPTEVIGISGYFDVVVNLERPTEEQKAEFSAKLIEVVRAGARAELGRSI